MKSGPKAKIRVAGRAERGAPKMPRGMSDDAKRFWREMVPALEELGVLHQVDGAALATAAETFAVMREALAVIRADGITQLDERGLVRKHPLFAVWRESAAQLRRWLELFGGVPAARQRMTTEAPAGEKTLAQLLFEAVESSDGGAP